MIKLDTDARMGQMNTDRYAYDNDNHEFNLHRASSRKSFAYLARAAKAAAESACRWQVGAVIVRSGSVLATGKNKSRNQLSSIAGGSWSDNPTYVSNVSTHAEIDAISRVKNPAGTSIYVVRLDKYGKHRNAKPCVDCARAIDEAGIAKVYYIDA